MTVSAEMMTSMLEIPIREAEGTPRIESSKIEAIERELLVTAEELEDYGGNTVSNAEELDDNLETYIKRSKNNNAGAAATEKTEDFQKDLDVESMGRAYDIEEQTEVLRKGLASMKNEETKEKQLKRAVGVIVSLGEKGRVINDVAIGRFKLLKEFDAPEKYPHHKLVERDLVSDMAKGAKENKIENTVLLAKYNKLTMDVTNKFLELGLDPDKLLSETEDRIK